MEDVDSYLADIASEVEKEKSSKRRLDTATGEPPKKKQHVEVIVKEPQPTSAYSFEFGESVPGHHFAPDIPLISETPIPLGYPPRNVSKGITAGRALVTTKNLATGKIPKAAPAQPTPTVPTVPQNQNKPKNNLTYHRAKAGEEWVDLTLNEFDPSKSWISYQRNIISILY